MDMISIIVPVYNVEAYLSQCVESILAQTYANIELILIDDGSMDKSGRICDKYAKRDSRVRVLHTDNQGVSSARNIGLRMAKGDCIAFVDSDDYIEPTMYEQLMNLRNEYAADICISNRAFRNEFAEDSHTVVSSYNRIEALKELYSFNTTSPNAVPNSIWGGYFVHR